MPRSVAEWVGKTPDTKAPPRVLLRVFQRESGICHISGIKILPGDKWQGDHKIALINGGKNCESNLFPALTWAHAGKTKSDVAEKAAVAARAKSHAGIRRRPKQPIAGDPNALKGPVRSHEGRAPAIGLSEIQRRYLGGI